MLRPSSARCRIARFFAVKKRSRKVAKEQNAAPDQATRPDKQAKAGAAGAAAPAKRKKEFKKKRERRIVPHGIVHIAATFNNTQITIADTDGRVVCWSSAGAIGFKGSRNVTPMPHNGCRPPKRRRV